MIMKRLLKLIMFAMFATYLVSCQSKEEKAEEFIKNELSKTLYDFDSYQPIETTVTEAKIAMFNDSACRSKAALIDYGIKKAKEYLNDAESAKEHMEIWGEPSYYSSSYSDNQYYKYKKEYEENFKKGRDAYEFCKALATELKEDIAKLDTTKVIGWEVKHRFRCKTKGGNSTIADYRYVFDMDFKHVILKEDKDDEDESRIRDVLVSVIQGDFEN